MSSKKIKIAASMACADFKNLEDEIKALEDAEIDLLHFDICDGYFAPTFLFSPVILKSLRPLTKIRFDVHMYCKHPSRYIDELACSGADLVVIHIEIEEDYKEVIKKILDLGLKAGIAILPGSKIPGDISDILTDISLIVTNTVGPAYAGQKFNNAGLVNMKEFDEIIKCTGRDLDIAADGGVNEKSIKAIVNSGANIFILGSTSLFFGSKDYSKKVKLFKNIVNNILDKTR